MDSSSSFSSSNKMLGNTFVNMGCSSSNNSIRNYTPTTASAGFPAKPLTFENNGMIRVEGDDGRDDEVFRLWKKVRVCSM